MEFEDESGEHSRLKAELAAGELKIKIELIGVDDVDESDEPDDVDESDDADADDGDDDGDDGDADADDREVFEIVGILEETFELAGGTVTILVRESEIILLEGDPAEGWELDVERIAGREARVEFGRDGERSRFKADLAGGRLLLRIDLLRADEADDDVDDADDPRDVFEIDGRFERTFELTGGDVMIIATESAIILIDGEAAEGWELDVQRITGREARVEFARDGEHSRFKAELAGGRLLVRIDLVEQDEAEEADDGDDADDESGPPRSESVVVEDAGIVTIRHSGRRILDVTVHEEDG